MTHKCRADLDDICRASIQLQSVLFSEKIRKEKTEPLSMSWAMIYTKNFNASDHRDKIFAVLNLADRTDLDLQPDYDYHLEEV